MFCFLIFILVHNEHVNMGGGLKKKKKMMHTQLDIDNQQISLCVFHQGLLCIKRLVTILSLLKQGKRPLHMLLSHQSGFIHVIHLSERSHILA